ncbi:MAG: AraC family transcriptional regulator [Myxococcaceae bacterium]|nr:MAG: AraC family transcriptional regulator [Myxococcaceae bacterium]
MSQPMTAREPATRQRFTAATRLERHRHVTGYTAVIVSGGYVEAGDSGRFRLHAGSVVFHRAFEAHANHFDTTGAVVLNLPLSASAPNVAAGLLRDLDAVVRLAGKDPLAAADLVASSSLAPVTGPGDWPDLLAQALRDNPALRLGQWAEATGLAVETVARGFKRAYGVSPKRYRADVRALQAWRRLPRSTLPLAQLALALGFSDQAHMTRDVVALTGRTPSALRSEGQVDPRTARR